MKRNLYVLAPAVLLCALAFAGCAAPPDAEEQAMPDAAAEMPAAVDMTHFNPTIDLLAAGQPLFGLYAPSAGGGRRGGRGGGEPRSAEERAQEALAYAQTDFIFDGSMEGNFERGYPGFAELSAAMFSAGMIQTSPVPHVTHPLAVKMHEIAPDPATAAANIQRQLNLGVSTVVFVDAKTADEVQAGIAAMRFASDGGTRPEDDLGDAPARWGMTPEEYLEKADVWPLDPNGELVNWTIVESLEGLENVREIAAVEGIGVLFPGAGTLRGVFTTEDENGERVRDEEAWEAAIQQVLAACQEFNVPCGYPANENDIEMRMQQGFSVFIMTWGEGGFRTIDIGRAAAGRTDN